MTWDDCPHIFIRPNWKSPFVVSTEFKTAVFEAESGDEQRQALREIPRRTIEFTGYLTGDDLRRFTSSLTTRRDDRFVIPFLPFSEAAISDGGVFPAASDRFMLAEPSPLFRWPGKVFLYDDDGGSHRNILTNTGVSGGNRVIVFEGSFGKDYAEGRLKAAPGLCVRLVANPNLTYHTSGVAEGQFTFEVEPGTEFEPAPFDVESTPSAPLNGIEVFTQRPNFAAPPTIMFEMPSEAVDFGVGRRRHFFRRAFNRQTEQMTFVGIGRENARGLEGLFLRQRGRCGAFYLPAWVDDVIASTTASLDVLEVSEPSDVDWDGRDPVQTVISGRDSSGNVVVRRVRSISTVGGKRQITLFQPWPNAQQDIRLGWVRMVRFSSDKLSLEWLTDAVAQTRISVQSVRETFGELQMGGLRILCDGDFITIGGAEGIGKTPTPIAVGGNYFLINRGFVGA